MVANYMAITPYLTSLDKILSMEQYSVTPIFRQQNYEVKFPMNQNMFPMRYANNL